MASACVKDAKRDTPNIADTGQTVREDVVTSPANICMSCLKNTVNTQEAAGLKIPIPMAKFFFSKSGPWHPKNGTKLKFNKKSLRKHAPKFQFQVRNSWVHYITFSVYQAFSCLTKCVILLLDILETWF